MLNYVMAFEKCQAEIAAGCSIVYLQIKSMTLSWN